MRYAHSQYLLGKSSIHDHYIYSTCTHLTRPPRRPTGLARAPWSRALGKWRNQPGNWFHCWRRNRAANLCNTCVSRIHDTTTMLIFRWSNYVHHKQDTTTPQVSHRPHMQRGHVQRHALKLHALRSSCASSVGDVHVDSRSRAVPTGSSCGWTCCSCRAPWVEPDWWNTRRRSECPRPSTPANNRHTSIN